MRAGPMTHCSTSACTRARSHAGACGCAQDVLAQRKIKKVRRPVRDPAASVSAAPAVPGNPFAAVALVAAEGSGATAPVAKPNPFASVNLVAGGSAAPARTQHHTQARAPTRHRAHTRTTQTPGQRPDTHHGHANQTRCKPARTKKHDTKQTTTETNQERGNCKSNDTLHYSNICVEDIFKIEWEIFSNLQSLYWS